MGGGGGGDDGGGEPFIDRNTSDYLLDVIDSRQFFRWTIPSGRPEIRLYINVDDRDVPSGFNRTTHVNNLVHARDAWKTAIQTAGVSIESYTRFSTTGSLNDPQQKCVIQVKYRDSIPGRRGQLTWNWVSGQRYQKLDGLLMELALRHPTTGQYLTNQQLRATVLHEFGHALGISSCPAASCNRHSGNEYDVMYHDTSVHQWDTLSGGDTRAIQHLYKIYPSVVRKD